MATGEIREFQEMANALGHFGPKRRLTEITSPLVGIHYMLEGAIKRTALDGISLARPTRMRHDRRAAPTTDVRRVTHDFRRLGLLVNHKRVQRVMRTLLAPPMPRLRSWLVAEPDAVTGSWYPNLRAHFTPTALGRGG